MKKNIVKREIAKITATIILMTNFNVNAFAEDILVESYDAVEETTEYEDVACEAEEYVNGDDSDPTIIEYDGISDESYDNSEDGTRLYTDNTGIKAYIADRPINVEINPAELAMYIPSDGCSEVAVGGVNGYSWEQTVDYSLREHYEKYNACYSYNMLDNDQRIIWDWLDHLAIGHLADQKTTFVAADLGDRTITLINSVPISIPITMSPDSVMEVINKFCMENPQYFYVANEIIIAPDTVTKGNIYSGSSTSEVKSDYKNLYIAGYSALSDDASRDNARIEMESIIDSIRNACDGKSDFEKIRTIHDYIIQNTSFDTQDTEFSHSAYGVLCKHIGTSDGYSQAFTMVCNSLGIDTVGIMSNKHQWNKVKVDNTWYNIDCSWDDNNTEGKNNKPNYEFFLKNDDYMLDADERSNNIGAHEPIYSNWYPVSEYTTESISDNACEPAHIATDKVSKPVMSESNSNGIKTITINCDTPGAKIYYSFDHRYLEAKGSGDNKISDVRARAHLYTGPFKGAGKIYAVAVKDGFIDSDVAEQRFDYAIDIFYGYDNIPINNNERIKNPNFFTYKENGDTLKLKEIEARYYRGLDEEQVKTITRYRIDDEKFTNFNRIGILTPLISVSSNIYTDDISYSRDIVVPEAVKRTINNIKTNVKEDHVITPYLPYSRIVDKVTYYYWDDIDNGYDNIKKIEKGYQCELNEAIDLAPNVDTKTMGNHGNKLNVIEYGKYRIIHYSQFTYTGENIVPYFTVYDTDKKMILPNKSCKIKLIKGENYKDSAHFKGRNDKAVRFELKIKGSKEKIKLNTNLDTIPAVLNKSYAYVPNTWAIKYTGKKHSTIDFIPDVYLFGRKMKNKGEHLSLRIPQGVSKNATAAVTTPLKLVGKYYAGSYADDAPYILTDNIYGCEYEGKAEGVSFNAVVTEKPFATKLKVKYKKKWAYKGPLEEIRPEVTVSYKGCILTEGKDYTVTYYNNRLPGKGYIIVRSINQTICCGEVVKQFKIK